MISLVAKHDLCRFMIYIEKPIGIMPVCTTNLASMAYEIILLRDIMQTSDVLWRSIYGFRCMDEAQTAYLDACYKYEVAFDL